MHYKVRRVRLNGALGALGALGHSLFVLFNEHLSIYLNILQYTLHQEG